jgi:ribonuclease R
MESEKKRKRRRSGRGSSSARNEKVFNNLCHVVPQFLSGKGYQPLSSEELAARLALPAAHKELFEKVLLALIDRGEIYCKQSRYALADSTQAIVTGVLRVHQRGFGFLQPDLPSDFTQDIFIPKNLTRNAVDGDTVEALVDTASISPKGPEGRVVSVLKRGRTHVAGTVKEIKKNGQILAHVPMVGSSRTVLIVNSEEDPVQLGDRLILKVLDWGSAQESPIVCEKSHYIGTITDPACDVPAALEEFDLRSDFPTAVLKEALQYGTKIPAAEIKKRVDFRELECFTIDPDTAKDYDDALSLMVDAKGHYHLGVHIADVSHYVSSGSELDKEAQRRCNSTYFPGYCLPMLPYELSNELCSLKPGVNRLALSVVMRFDAEGTLLGHEIVRSVIKSKKRFTYKEAKQVLEGTKESPYSQTLHTMEKLCRLLKKKRYQRGGIEFALPEVAIYCDDTGMPIKTERIEYDITHQIVEEFMLKANEMVATHLTAQGNPLAFRVHEEPSEENLKEFAILARALGFNLKDKPQASDLQRLFDEAMATPLGPQLAVYYIRSMRLAYYSPSNIGHYGLSLEYYCHFTSPIRRYIDLVIHRIICGDLHELPHLEAISLACSQQERISAKAEQNVLLLKKLRLVETYREKGKTQYTGTITRVKNVGIIFEIAELMMEGFLHISEIGQDFYLYNEQTQRLQGRYSGETFQIGQAIPVELEDLNLITLDCRFRFLSKSAQNPDNKQRKRTRERTRRKR